MQLLPNSCLPHPEDRELHKDAAAWGACVYACAIVLVGGGGCERAYAGATTYASLLHQKCAEMCV